MLKWDSFTERILRAKPRQDLRIPKGLIESPLEANFIAGKGLPKGQLADWRKTLKDGRGLHIREYETDYKIHWDEVDPGLSLVKHLSQDTPRLFMFYLMSFGAAAGAVLSSLNHTGRGHLAFGSLVGALSMAIVGTFYLGSGN